MSDIGPPDGIGLPQPGIVEIVNLGIALAIIIAGGLSVLFIFLGGINFILSGGDDEKVKKAVHTIRYAIIGLIITIFAVTFVALIGSIFNFPLTKYIQWDNMTEFINGIIERMTNDSDFGTQERETLN